MAGSCSSIRPRLLGSSSPMELFNRAEAPAFSARISTRSRVHGGGVIATTYREEGPSCIYVGPIDSASKETLEALYSQARDAYYNGKPLIVDDMFDRVELKLRWYGSKSVVKYPRCSLLRQSTYADAEEDTSQVFALASIWILILVFGSSACLLPAVYVLSLVYGDPFDLGIAYSGQLYSVPFSAKLNGILFTVLGCAFGSPIASSAVGVLQGLWRNDLAALRGACPNCGEEVFAFVRSDQSNSNAHRADCHVCGCTLEFRTKVEKNASPLGRKWIYGRIYLVSRQRRNRRSKMM
ncbi:PREDICTED: PGR5-like protein 1A, chloroplastic isoform X2 [Tarenaya hassleriana]|nr:PREDICTED: PGR5-like protein 1A, chloroplastic isoform X2 [Tarenaya hassleriana]XP_010535490.1 PREDICTED: PGR5-like protein 1A, chloroplastic isoform X2 [Tarenaya hassleriana]